MADEKACPLLLSAAVGRVSVAPRSSACQGTACAWYDTAADRCALLTLARRA